MPMYGLAKCATASSTNNRKNENRLPITMTNPARLSQFRSSEGCGGDGPIFSAFMSLAVLYQTPAQCWAERLPGTNVLGSDCQAPSAWSRCTFDHLTSRPA